MLRLFLKWISKVCVSGILAIGILSLFVFQYEYLGPNLVSPTGATDYVDSSNQIVVEREEGNAINRMDGNGYPNSYPSKNNGEIDVLLMGASNLKGEFVAPENNIGYQLNDLLPDLYTYSIAEDQHVIYTNVKNIENAVRAFPAKYVVIETSSIEMDYDAMNRVLQNEYENIQFYHGTMTDIMKKYLPAVRFMWSNVAKKWMPAGDENTLGGGIDYKSQFYQNTLDAFLSKAASPTENLIIYYHPSTEIDASGKLLLDADQDALAAFRKSCKNNGIVFVDMTEDFENLYYGKHQLPYGFTNSRLGRGHMNEYGNQVVAECLAEVIASLEEQGVE